MRQVFKAFEHQHGEMGSLGRASYMLIRQSNFPDTYSDSDLHVMVDHDRIQSEDCTRSNDCFTRHTGIGPLNFEYWVKRASPEDVINFLVDYMKPDQSVKWTGFRVMGGVHRGNGYPVWTLELFYKHPESQTKVYSEMKNVPNVAPSKLKQGKSSSRFF